MKFRSFRGAAAFAALLTMTLALALSANPAYAQQTYRNIVNARFRTISNGPQSALIVDVKDPTDLTTTRQAIMRQYQARLQANRPAMQQELNLLRRYGLIRPNQELDVPAVAIVRHNGRLAIPAAQRTRAGGDITFTIPTSGDGAWTAAQAQDLQTLVNLLYTELKNNIIGAPGWSGNVTILNKDPRLGKVDEPIGALLSINGNNVEILFPTFAAYETRFLAMAQVMAQAFHGPKRIAYDAWEMGMGRAAAVVAARNLASVTPEFVNPANGFFYTPYYDLLNQPPLGNNTFTPPTKSDQPFSLTTLSGMLIPRLQMSSTAWLKCFIENPNFFKSFNAAYYAAYTGDPTIANDVSRLRDLAAGAVPQVELLPFSDWFERQYVLDTSVTVGRKLYVFSLPLFPSSTSGGDSGMAAFVVYYDTTSTGDEVDRNASADLVYWDYTFQNRLTLPSFEKVDIVNGFGSVSPYFSGIGGTPADTMRVAIDFPVNKEYVRINFPAGETGTAASPTNFAGVVVGADAGSLTVTFDGGGTVNTSVAQGVFGATAPGSVPNGFSRTRLTFTPAGGTPINYQRNTFQRPEPASATSNNAAVSPIFVLAAPGPVDTLTHTFSQGAQMISIPLRPLAGDLAKMLGISPNATLLAQYRQDAGGNGDKFSYYPSIPLYQPGYGLWSNFQTTFTANAIKGQRTDIETLITVPLQFGWNQIGTPYNTNLNITQDLIVQYLGGDVLSFTDAIARGWIAAGVIGYSQTAGYQDIMTTTDQTFPRNLLEPWKGYWVRVLVTEGVTLSYSNPNGRAVSRNGRAVRTRAATTKAVDPFSEPGGWRVPLTVRDANGNLTGAVLGQSPRGSDTFTPSLDIASPPAFSRAATLGVRFTRKPGDAATEFLADIRRASSRAQWDVIVTAPQTEQTYTLAWSNMATLPKGTRLTLTDLTTGTRQLMNSSSGITIQMGRGETTRRLQIVAEPRSLGRLVIRNVVANMPQVTGGRAVSHVAVSYELSAAAETRVEVLSGGRVIRRIAAGRAAAAGVNQFIWDIKDDRGIALPSGPYVVQITARTPDGEQTRTVMPIVITR